MTEKLFREKSSFFSSMAARGQTVDLTSKLLRVCWKAFDRAIKVFCSWHPSPSSSWVTAAFFRIKGLIAKNLRFLDLLVTSFCTWSKNDLTIFHRTLHELSNAFCRLSLRCVVFEIFVRSDAVGAQVLSEGHDKMTAETLLHVIALTDYVACKAKAPTELHNKNHAGISGYKSCRSKWSFGCNNYLGL